MSCQMESLYLFQADSGASYQVPSDFLVSGSDNMSLPTSFSTHSQHEVKVYKWWTLFYENIV